MTEPTVDERFTAALERGKRETAARNARTFTGRGPFVGIRYDPNLCRPEAFDFDPLPLPAHDTAAFAQHWNETLKSMCRQVEAEVNEEAERQGITMLNAHEWELVTPHEPPPLQQNERGGFFFVMPPIVFRRRPPRPWYVRLWRWVRAKASARRPRP